MKDIGRQLLSICSQLIKIGLKCISGLLQLIIKIIDAIINK